MTSKVIVFFIFVLPPPDLPNFIHNMTYFYNLQIVFAVLSFTVDVYNWNKEKGFVWLNILYIKLS